MEETKIFVKHLPTGEERQKGELIQLSASKEVIVWNGEDHWQGVAVRPYAVIKDVSKGDAVKVRNGADYIDGEITWVHDNGSAVEVDVGWSTTQLKPRESCFILLAEISPNADWIKEGDKIKGELIKHCKIHGSRDALCSCHEKGNGNGYLLFEVECDKCGSIH